MKSSHLLGCLTLFTHIYHRCCWTDLHHKQVPHRQIDHQRSIYNSVRRPQRCHRLLPRLSAEERAFPYERDVPYRHYHRHLLHSLCPGKTTPSPLALTWEIHYIINYSSAPVEDSSCFIMHIRWKHSIATHSSWKTSNS